MMSENFDDVIMTASLQHRKGHRTVAQMVDNVEKHNRIEDKIARHIRDVHNSLPLKTTMGVHPLGQREGLIRVMKKDEGDSMWGFDGNNSFVVPSVEIKKRINKGYQFRPRKEHATRCIDNDRPYALIQNFNTPTCGIIILGNEDLQWIIENDDLIQFETRFDKKWTPYLDAHERRTMPLEKWPWYYLSNANRYEERRVPYDTLLYKNSTERWLAAIEFLRTYGEPFSD